MADISKVLLGAVAVLLLVGGALMVRHQGDVRAERARMEHLRAEEALELALRAEAAARRDGEPSAEGPAPHGGHPEADDLRDENARLRAEADQLRDELAALQAEVARLAAERR